MFELGSNGLPDSIHAEIKLYIFQQSTFCHVA